MARRIAISEGGGSLGTRQHPPRGGRVDAVTQRRPRRQVARCRLSPVLRETVALHYLADRSIEQISQEPEVPIGTVARSTVAGRNSPTSPRSAEPTNPAPSPDHSASTGRRPAMRDLDTTDAWTADDDAFCGLLSCAPTLPRLPTADRSRRRTPRGDFTHRRRWWPSPPGVAARSPSWRLSDSAASPMRTPFRHPFLGTPTPAARAHPDTDDAHVDNVCEGHGVTESRRAHGSPSRTSAASLRTSPTGTDAAPPRRAPGPPTLAVPDLLAHRSPIRLRSAPIPPSTVQMAGRSPTGACSFPWLATERGLRNLAVRQLRCRRLLANPSSRVTSDTSGKGAFGIAIYTNEATSARWGSNASASTPPQQHCRINSPARHHQQVHRRDSHDRRHCWAHRRYVEGHHHL